MFKHYLDKLSIASKEAVVDGNRNSFDDFKEYLHIDRFVQSKLEDIVLSSLQDQNSKLILISGNVGDGKSHMMSRLHMKYPNEMEKIQVRNDATESTRTDRSWIDELNDFLSPFTDASLSAPAEKTTRIVAINLGILSSFLENTEDFILLDSFVKRKGIIDSLSFNNDYLPDSPFQFINLADYSLFTLKEDNSSSKMISELLHKITYQDESNPFYKGYLSYYNSHPNLNGCAMRQNYLEISKQEVQKGLIDLIMYAIISLKLIISVRDLLNFIYDIIVPYDLQNVSGDKIKETKTQTLLKPQDFIYNKLFDSEGRSELLTSLASLDPNKFRSKYLDNLIFKLSSSEHPLDIFNHYGLTCKESWLQPRKNEILIKTFIRSLYLNQIENFDVELSNFQQFSRYLFRYYSNDKIGLRPLYKEIIKAIYSWNGNSKRPEEINVAIGQHQLKYNITQKITLDPAIKAVSNSTELDEIHEFGNVIEIGMSAVGHQVTFSLDINLYILLKKVIDGYSPNKLDRENHTDFHKAVEAITRLSSQGKAINFERLDGASKKQFQLIYNSEFGYEFAKI
ncbi:DNA phosphorothioation-dependent restriction protein DptF [Pedobacter sp. MC2016-15]|uniref:DNA phosphorothioation-dependent restriction protein DptF n=1 Tax=Pedobacter sp. MC2016-15 TaxID=2994473 RepID=UPI002247A058|nr:DNA phosphorothioation-dependent restriction protein DptF [Pedobacter sp. MC2016-15]MCX2478372.1 DNA phosphorothioation-dependent restriction protein DptF [Pedobacter sp. MC2016-15]